MSRTCTICTHPERAAIEAAIVVATSYRDIARQYAVSKDAIHRHKENCIKQSFQQAQEERSEASGINVAREMIWCNEQVHCLYLSALGGEKPDRRLALSAMGEIRKQSELWAELQGDLDRGTHIELHQSAEWANVREIIFQALQPYPEAKVAVARALFALGGADGRKQSA